MLKRQKWIIAWFVTNEFIHTVSILCICRLQGEPVNLREQHDALEFLNSLVDSLDEALKALGYTPILTRVLGGSFADQKICKDCPHRWHWLFMFCWPVGCCSLDHGDSDATKLHARWSYQCIDCWKGIQTVKKPPSICKCSLLERGGINYGGNWLAKIQMENGRWICVHICIVVWIA